MRKVHKFLVVFLVLLGLQSFSLAAVNWEISPWMDDATSGIFSSKIYTHAINNNSTDDGVVTVNGVDFDNVRNEGSVEDGWTLAGGLWASDSTVNIVGDSAGLALNTSFHYFTSELVLYNLTPEKEYELTLYSVAWEDGTREVTLTEGGESFIFNQDQYGNNNGIKIVGIYTADSSGELHVGVTNGFHIYAFANSEYGGVIISPVSPDEFEGGNRVPTDTVLVWEELYNSLTNPAFDIYVSDDEKKVSELDADALVSAKHNEYRYNPDLDPNTLYYWRVATYLDADDSEPNIVTDIRSFRTEYVDEHWTDSVWTDDSNSGISLGKIYTHKVNFNSTESAETIVNNIVFENDNDRTGNNWFLEGAGSSASGGHNVGGDGGTLVNSIYHGNGAVLTLTGLIPGQDYVLTKYTRGWGNPGGRLVHLFTSVDNRVTTLDGNIDGNGNGHLFKYSYTAPASGELVISFSQLSANDTWHHYAFSNEIAVPAYVDPSPIEGASVGYDVELSWELNGMVTSPTYNLKVATDEAMNNLVADESGLSVTSHKPYLESDKTYYWQVEIVEDGSSVIYFSPVWSFVTTPPQEALKVIEWKFDEITGIIAEQTAPTEDADGKLVGFNDPNSIGNSSHIAGLVNNGLYLNGKDEYVDVSDAYKYMPTASGQSFAISGYIRSFDNYGPIFSMRNVDDENPIIDIALGADGVQTRPGKVCVLVRDDNGSMNNMYADVLVNDGRWHNFIVTRVGSKWTLYIDGTIESVINGAATGNVDLNLMGIGASLRWINDDWSNENTILRDFNGIVDEYTVWDGELLPSQIEALASIIPGKGDIDFDLDTDIDDLAVQAGNWLADTKTAVQDNFVVEDMEGYESGQTSFINNWVYEPAENYGTLELSVIPDPNVPSHDQILKIDYDFAGHLHSFVHVDVPNRGADLGLYDQIEITLKKLPGCEISDLILDFYDARGIVDPEFSDLYNKGRMGINISEVVQGEWVTVSGTIPNDIDLKSCSDMSHILFSIQDGGEDIGTLYVDSIVLIDSTEDCVPQIGQMVPDFNGDCTVDLVDFSDIAESWLSTN